MIYDIRTLREAYKSGEIAPADVLEVVEANRQRLEPEVQAFTALSPDFRETMLKAADRDLPLAGIVVGIKDLADVRGLVTTGGSRAYDRIAEADSAVVAAWRQAGAAIAGKTNTQEFAYGVTTPPTRNPWNTDCVPGGSSGGSAAALAAGMVLGALGTDTGGSVRIPACCCGVVGFKPTYGVVSRRGIMPLSESFDHAGPMAHTVDGARLLFEAMVGYDAGDPQSRALKDMRRQPTRRLGVPRAYFDGICTREVLTSFEKAAQYFRDLGYILEDVAMPPWTLFQELQMTIRLPEAYVTHQTVLEGPKRSLLKGDLAERLDPGRDISALAYVAAQRRRFDIARSLDDTFSRYDAWLMPTLPTAAPRTDAEMLHLTHEDITVWQALVRLTTPWSTLGLPAISVPCGFSEGGLPLGLQIIGNRDDDFALLSLAERFEKDHAFAGQVAPGALPLG